jgi:hypothetical protein
MRQAGVGLYSMPLTSPKVVTVVRRVTGRAGVRAENECPC